MELNVLPYSSGSTSSINIDVLESCDTTCPKLLISGNSNLFREGYNGGGVYAISGLAPSKFDLPIYIGSSCNLKKRIEYGHLVDLQKNVHSNKLLQRYYNLHGYENCVIWLLEETSKDNQFDVEQKYIDYYGTAKDLKSFNISTIAEHVSSFSSLPIETQNALKKKRQESQSGRKLSENTKLKMSIARKGKNNPMKNPEVVEKQAFAKALPFKFISPNGQIVEGVNLKQFCKLNNLNQGNMNAIRLGLRITHKGWKKFN